MSDAKVVYLENRGLGGQNDYSIEITSEGVTVYSECCCDTMSDEVARATYEALGKYLAMRAKVAEEAFWKRSDASEVLHQYRQVWRGDELAMVCSCGNSEQVIRSVSSVTGWKPWAHLGAE